MRYWTCQRQAKGIRCKHVNPARKRLCEKCSKPKPVRKRPAHMSALDLSYDEYIKINGGEFCGICGKEPEGRRLDRDHDHKTGKGRGLLCWQDNRQLKGFMTVEWLEAASEYLKRANKLE